MEKEKTPVDPQLEVLLEMRDFLRRHKQEIAKELGESDNALRQALKEVKDTSYYSVNELKRQITEQNEAFKSILNEELRTFTDLSNAMKLQFDQQIKAYPSVAERLEDMAEMPHKIDRLINKMEQYNWQLVENVNSLIKHSSSHKSSADTSSKQQKTHGFYRLVVCITLPIIAACAVIIAFALVSARW